MSHEARPIALEHPVLFVRGLHVEARVGVHAHERGGTQPLVVDLEIGFLLPDLDEISATLDYVQAATLVRRTAISRHFDLVETFAQNVCCGFSKIEKIATIFIRVTKPSALAGWASSTGVELRARRT